MATQLTKSHYWTNIIVITGISILGFFSNRMYNKFDRFMDDYNRKNEIITIHLVTDSLYKMDNTRRVNNLIQDMEIIKAVINSNGIKFEPLEAILPKKKEMQEAFIDEEKLYNKHR